MGIGKENWATLKIPTLNFDRLELRFHQVQLESLAMAGSPQVSQEDSARSWDLKEKKPHESMVIPIILFEGLHSEPKLAYFVSVMYFLLYVSRVFLKAPYFKR